MATTPVGDRHVLAELLQRGWALGGEQSGHIIDTGFVPAGDGTAAALLALEALGRRATWPSATRWGSCRSGCSTCGCADRDALDGADDVWAAVERGRRRSRAAAGYWYVRPVPSR